MIAVECSVQHISDFKQRVREYETKELKHRAAIVNELLETETSYVRDLGVLIGVRGRLGRSNRCMSLLTLSSRFSST